MSAAFRIFRSGSTLACALGMALVLTPAFAVPAVAIACGTLAGAALGQSPEQFREVSGKVVNAQHQPVKGAVVQIENESSQAIMSYVTDADGYFHFKRVSGNDDFRVWATLNGASTKKHELSKFNSKDAPFFTLILE